LYGLRQAALAWSRHLHAFLTKLGYAQAAKDQCLYYKHDADGFTLIATEVDDLVITGNSDPQREHLRLALVKAFAITTWEPIASFLGMHIEYDTDAGILQMNMTKKIENLFKEQHSFLASCGTAGSGAVPETLAAIGFVLFALVHHFFVSLMMRGGMVIFAADGALACDVAAGIATAGKTVVVATAPPADDVRWNAAFRAPAVGTVGAGTE